MPLDSKMMVYMEKSMHEWLKQAAETEGCSESGFIRRLMRREQSLWESPKSPDTCTPEEYEVIRALRGLMAGMR